MNVIIGRKYYSLSGQKTRNGSDIKVLHIIVMQETYLVLQQFPSSFLSARQGTASMWRRYIVNSIYSAIVGHSINSVSWPTWKASLNREEALAEHDARIEKRCCCIAFFLLQYILFIRSYRPLVRIIRKSYPPVNFRYAFSGGNNSPNTTSSINTGDFVRACVRIHG